MEGLPLLLRELINNLIDNALQHTPRGGSVTVRVARSQADDDADVEGAQQDAVSPRARILLEVEDTGVGIPAADHPRIFDRFYQVLGGRSEGSGLGLAIVMEIASQHQARLSVVSPVRNGRPGIDGGTRFEVVFPEAAEDLAG